MDLSSLRKVPIQNSVPLATVSPPDPTHRAGGRGAHSAQGALEGKVADRVALRELLSEFVAVDQAVIAAYKTVIARTADPAIQPQLQEYLAQNLRQLDLIENVLRSLGGKSAASGAARPAAARLMRMIDLVPAARGQAQLEADLQALVQMETERRDNWLFLEEIGPALGDETASSLMAGRIGDLNIEQELHVEWTLGALNALRMRRLRLPEPSMAS